MLILKAYISISFFMQLIYCSAYKNILFIISDDMRPQINEYLKNGSSPILTFPKMNTPNLDKLSKRSIVFHRAYCQYPFCGPSRASVLTSRRPDTTRVYDLVNLFRDVGGDFVTIPQYFKERGYTSLGVGKVFHQSVRKNSYGDSISWSQDQKTVLNYWANKDQIWRELSEEDIRLHHSHDDVVTERSLKFLDQLGTSYKSEQKPFFLAVGYRKPHIPFIAPDKCFNYYKQSGISIAKNLYAPEDMQAISFNGNAEYGKRHADFPSTINDTVNTELAKDIRCAYYACVSYVDSLIGQLLQRIDENGLSEDTIIVFWGDHGYHLGENGSWGKRQLFEIDNRVPLILHIPGRTNEGIVTQELVELVDIFPTLVEAAGFPPLVPCPKYSQDIKLCTEGNSLIPLLKQPVNREWKKAVFSQANEPYANSLTHHYMFAGYSVKTDRYRYTEWHPYNESTYAVDWTKLEAVELYDHFVDPGETKNIAVNSTNQIVMSKLRKLLHAMDKTRYNQPEYNTDGNEKKNYVEEVGNGPTNYLEEVEKRGLSNYRSGSVKRIHSFWLDNSWYSIVIIILVLLVCNKLCKHYRKYIRWL